MIKRIISSALSVLTVIICVTNHIPEVQGETVTHTVTFLDFDGEPIQIIEVSENQKINYSKIDTSYLNRNLDKYTQIQFIGWDKTPETVTKDTVINALSQIGVITISRFPEKVNYYERTGEIDLNGLYVSITIIKQLPELDANGERKTEKIVENISQSCKTVPKNLNEAFKNGDVATVSIYPMKSDLSIYDYNINFISGKGDVNLDGAIDASDASIVLTYYANNSVGKEYKMSERQINCSDVDSNSSVNSLDASYILTYYAMNATGQNPKWENIIRK